MLKKIIKQAFHFFIITGLGWIIDVIIFYMLSKFVNIPTMAANIISSGIAATYVYIFSTKKVFTNSGRYSLKTKYIVFILYQFCLIFISSYIISVIATNLSILFEENNYKFLLDNVKLVAKIINTPITMIVNFIVMKVLIEKL